MGGKAARSEGTGWMLFQQKWLVLEMVDSLSSAPFQFKLFQKKDSDTLVKNIMKEMLINAICLSWTMMKRPEMMDVCFFMNPGNVSLPTIIFKAQPLANETSNCKMMEV